jgi:hypothetical protein
MKRVFLLVCLILFLAPISWAQDKLGAPTLNVGDSWKYRADNGMEWTSEIIGAEKDVYISKSAIPEGNRKGEWVRHYEKGSLNCVKSFRDGQVDREDRDRIKKAYDFPLYAGKKWKCRYDVFTVTRKFDSLLELKVVGFEEVEVPAGKFRAVKVEAKQTILGTNRSGTFCYWYCPDVKATIKSEFLPSGDFWRSMEYNKYELISFELK